jgi:hypothetical protein
MGFSRAFFGFGLGLALGGIAVGCSSAHEMDHGDAGSVGGDGGPVGEACGATTCAVGLVCCNASCGICTEPSTGCIDLECQMIDAGPGPQLCGGIAGISCPANQFCDFPDHSFCGGDDEQGICRPIPTDCPEPGGVPVCGCDGVDYLGECAANFAGTDIAHTGECAPPPTTQGISASSSCGPADGPAWDFQIVEGPPVCGGIPTSASLSLSVWDWLDAAPSGSVYRIGGDFAAAQGQATYCPDGGGGPPCLVLTGTVTLDHFASGSSASFSYDLTGFDGSRYTGSHVTVGLWCPSHPLCG